MSLERYPNIVADALVYFAKFPLHANVVKIFTKPASASSFAAYQALQTQINNLEEKELLPEIAGFVFGPDKEVVSRQIEDLGGDMFLFLDYGDISTNQDPTTRALTDNFALSVTVARCYKQEDLNIPEMVLLGDQTLNAVRAIRAQMIADQQCSPFMRQILFPNQVIPWYARELQNSQGWTMVLQRSAIDML